MKEYKTILWDFDGVIKESLAIKADSFADLFENIGINTRKKIKAHHLNNGGVSRYIKIPLYLDWANLPNNKDTIDYYCKTFSNLVINKVISSKWVPGVEKILRKNPFNQEFHLISATPDFEIEIILKRLNLHKCFGSIFGSSLSKIDSISKIINSRGLNKLETIFIGDTITDYEAAKKNDISFLLRETEEKTDFNTNYYGLKCNDFLNFTN
jgi:phosphoglycolate phosphatase-like HAD superfamily hydrolase